MRMRPLRPRHRPASKQASRAFLIGLGTIVIGIGTLMVYVAFDAPNAIPLRSYFYVRAEFKNAQNITKHAEVRLGGEIVGQVLDPHVVRGMAVMTLQVEPSVRPLRSDTRLVVRPRSAIGTEYLQVLPGLHGTPLAPYAMIPASQTSASIPLDSVLSTFDPRTRANAQLFLRSLGEGLLGQGQNLNSALQDAPSMLSGARQVLGAIAQRPGAITHLIDGSQGAAAAVDPVRAALASGFQPEADALRPFYDSAAAVQQTLEVAPPALDQVRVGLAQTGPLIAAVHALAINATPDLAAAPQALIETNAMMRQGQPGLRSAVATVRRLGTGVPPTLALLQTLDPVMPIVRGTLSEAQRLVITLGQRTCDIKLFGNGWDGIMRYGNAEGGYLRLNLVGGLNQQSIYGLGSSANVPLGQYQDAYPAPCAVSQDVVR